MLLRFRSTHRLIHKGGNLTQRPIAFTCSSPGEILTRDDGVQPEYLAPDLRGDEGAAAGAGVNGGKAPKGSNDRRWICPSCTFENADARTICKMWVLVLLPFVLSQDLERDQLACLCSGAMPADHQRNVCNVCARYAYTEFMQLHLTHPDMHNCIHLLLAR